MDYLAATARTSPAAMAAGPLADATRELTDERCRLLARVGFIAPLHGDADEITGLGERYLKGEVNAALYAPWGNE